MSVANGASYQNDREIRRRDILVSALGPRADHCRNPDEQLVLFASP